MTTLQRILITLAIAGLAGAGIYAARKTIQLRTRVQTLQQAQAPQLAQFRQLQKERDGASNRLAAAARRVSAASLLRLPNGKSQWRLDKRKPLPCNDLKRRVAEIIANTRARLPQTVNMMPAGLCRVYLSSPNLVGLPPQDGFVLHLDPQTRGTPVENLQDFFPIFGFSRK